MYAGVAAMRSGDLERAESDLSRVRTTLVELGLAEHVDDLDSRLLELALLRGDVDPTELTALLDKFASPHPLASRVLRCAAMVAWEQGDRAGAGRHAREAVEAADSTFDRALALLTAHRCAVEPSGRAEVEASEILAELGVLRPPPQLPGDVRSRT
jgi:hypothetical protein